MNINQIEQALRNLIASQPMVSNGPSGEVISSIANVIDAFKTLNYRAQTYPSQDNLKFALQNDCVKLESDICNYAVSVLQERGINILLYLPAQNSPYSGFAYGAGQNYVPGQMMFTPGAQMMGQPGGYANGFYPQNSDGINPQTTQQNTPQAENKEYYKKPETQEKEEGDEESVFEQAVSEPSFDELEKVEEKQQIEEPAETEKQASETQEKENQEKENQKHSEKAETTQPKPAKAGIKPAGSSNGRDYLLELLKK